MDRLVTLNDKSSIAFDELFQRFTELDITPLLVYLIDNSSALAHLAEQFHITGKEGWLVSKDENEKRLLIKNSIELHKYKGTKYALNKVLETLNLEGKIVEWFEYSGDPYCFKAEIDLLTRGLSKSIYQDLVDLINEYKNERSHLESFRIYLKATSDVPKISGIAQFGKVIMAEPYYEKEKTTPELTNYISGAYHIIHIIQAEA